VLVDEAVGKACLVVAIIGPAILAWPLTLVEVEAGGMGLVYNRSVRKLDTLFLADPFRSNANHETQTRIHAVRDQTMGRGQGDARLGAVPNKALQVNVESKNSLEFYFGFACTNSGFAFCL
jgi:hypothetical protein